MTDIRQPYGVAENEGLVISLMAFEQMENWSIQDWRFSAQGEECINICVPLLDVDLCIVQSHSR